VCLWHGRRKKRGARFNGVMSSIYLDKLIESKVSGDKKRILELFQDDSVFLELVRNEHSSDWFRFQENTFDGEYLIKKNNKYVCFQQDRGIKFGTASFENIAEAAKYLFKRRY